MKVTTRHGELEGVPGEIRDFCKITDFDATNFFQSEKRISKAWVIVPSFLYIVMGVILVLNPLQDPKAIKLLTFAALILMVFIVSGVHLIFKNVWISSFTAFIFLLSLAMLMGWVEPYEAVKKLTETYNNSKR